MLKRRLVEQREETRVLLAKPLRDRELLAEFRKALSNRLIKVIIGPRRCGKTILSLMGLKGREFHYLNFDDEILGSLRGEQMNELLELLHEVDGRKEILILDEIQNIEGWELFVNRLQRGRYHLVVTGSNSKLLSRELSAHLTGRTQTLELLPFSFREYLGAEDSTLTAETIPEIGLMRKRLDAYAAQGGFPEVLMGLAEPERKKKYLRELFEATVLRDAVQRYRIGRGKDLLDLARVIAGNFSRRTSFKKLSRSLGPSEITLKKYAGYLEDAYLILGVKRFSFKAAESERSIRKYYLIDSGFVQALGFSQSRDFGFLMENIVAVELKRRNMDFYYYLADGRNEVDFVIRENRKIARVIQVTFDEKPMALREVASGLKACQELRTDNLIVITWHEEDVQKKNGVTIRFIPLWKWLIKAGSKE